MLNKIIRFSLNNRLLVLVLSVLLMVAGLYTATTMDVDVFPDLNAPTVTVMTEAKGMAPEEVERLVTFPIETAVNGATDVRRVRSSSTTGFSIVWVEFDWGTDIYRARQIVSEKIATVMDALPGHVGTPTLGPQSSILGEVLFVGLTVDGHKTSMQDLRTLADWTIRPRLLATGGVAQVAVLGGEVKEYQILLSPEKMMHYDVSLGEVMEVVSDMNQNATGGTLYEYGNEYIIRGMLSTNDVDEIGRTVVKRVGESPLLLHHIAEVKIGDQRPKFGMASLRTEPAVILTVTHCVDCQPEGVEREYGNHKGQWDGDERDECGAHIHQEHEEYDDHKEGSLNESTLHIVNRVVDEALLTVYIGGEHHIGRQFTLEVFECSVQLLGEF